MLRQIEWGVQNGPITKNGQKQPPEVFCIQVFSCEFPEIFKNTFLQNTSE